MEKIPRVKSMLHSATTLALSHPTRAVIVPGVNRLLLVLHANAKLATTVSIGSGGHSPALFALHGLFLFPVARRLPLSQPRRPRPRRRDRSNRRPRRRSRSTRSTRKLLLARDFAALEQILCENISLSGRIFAISLDLHDHGLTEDSFSWSYS